MGLYNRLLQRCELNRHTTEAAAGALQNITAGDRRVSELRGPTPGLCWALGHMDGNHALAVHGLLGEGSLRVRHETHAQPEEWGPGFGF